MERLFAVTYSPGTAWLPSRPMEAQRDWEAHAALMDAFVAGGFVLLGGPLEGTQDVLLVVRAADEEEVRSRFSTDPWLVQGVRRISALHPWTLRLGSL